VIERTIVASKKLILIYWKILERISYARQPAELHFARWILISVLGMYLNFKVVMKSSSSVLKKECIV
jgi:hypothetical protein